MKDVINTTATTFAGKLSSNWGKIYKCDATLAVLTHSQYPAFNLKQQLAFICSFVRYVLRRPLLGGTRAKRKAKAVPPTKE